MTGGAADAAAGPPWTVHSRLAAFLRGINLGNRRLKMDELGRHFEALGLEGVATYLASGNVVFDSTGDDLPGLEARIEAHLREALGYEVDTFLRPLADLARIPRHDAVARAVEDGFRPQVIFLGGALPPSAEPDLRALEGEDDRFVLLGREVVWLRRGGLTGAPFTTRELERALGVDNTIRTLNTVRRLVKKFGPDGGE